MESEVNLFFTIVAACASIGGVVATMTIWDYEQSVHAIRDEQDSIGGHSIDLLLAYLRGIEPHYIEWRGMKPTRAQAAQTLRNIRDIVRDIEHSFHWLIFAKAKKRCLKKMHVRYPGLQDLLSAPDIDTLLASK